MMPACEAVLLPISHSGLSVEPELRLWVVLVKRTGN
jgi:hypothetical protein